MRLVLPLALLLCACPQPPGPLPSCGDEVPARAAACPASFTDARALCQSRGPCADAGVTDCWYPAAGDILVENQHRCGAPGLLTCFVDGDGGSEWRCAQ